MLQAMAGFLVAVLSWICVAWAITWSVNRQVAALNQTSHPSGTQYQPISIKAVMTYHTVGWTITLLVGVVLLEMAAFPLWQQLGFAGMLALVYGVNAVSRGESEWVGKDDPAAVILFGRRRDQVWYRTLMVAEWASYLVSIVFLAHLGFSVAG